MGGVLQSFAHGPWIPEHGYMLAVSRERLEVLKSDLAESDACSQSIPKIPTRMRGRWMLCLISTSRHFLTHVARSVVRYPAESGRDKLDIWNMTPLVKPVRISAIKAKLKGRQTWRAKRALDGGHISSSAFELVMEALRKADEAAFGIADGLIDHSPVPRHSGSTTSARTNWAYQRDAVVTSLEIARIPKEQLAIAPQLGEDAPSDLTSIFDSDGDVTTIEDLAILQDLDAADEGWEFVKRQRYPAKLFTNGDIKLNIILANKLTLEKQLGVDLIYVNETLNAVVFVQYKMFSGADGEDGYRPDKQLVKEIARMDTAATELTKVGADETCGGYRFGIDPFFLKFCSKLLTHDDRGHVPGIYVPLSYWKRLAKTPAVMGKKGGTVVYAETFGRRYFTPTHFIDMVGRGWVGTATLQTNVIVPYLSAAMEGKKGVVLAVQSGNATEPNCEDPPHPSRMPPKPPYPGRKPRVFSV